MAGGIAVLIVTFAVAAVGVTMIYNSPENRAKRRDEANRHR